MERTPRSELLGWRAVAGQALARFGVEATSFSLVKCGENITYRVRRQRADDLLLRIHRPVYHSTEEIRSELDWVKALGETAAVPVPAPLEAPDGERVVPVRPGDGHAPHCCTLLRWLPGGLRSIEPTPRDLRALGRTTAHLHQHVLGWPGTAGARRKILDWKGLLSSESNWGRFFGGLPGFFAPADRPAVEAGLTRIQEAMRQLDGMRESRSLIHADLHFGNVVFARGLACPIDFDDCGIGYLAYDVATTLVPYFGRPGFEALKEALLQGYSEVRPFPEEQLARLPELLVTRRLTMALWLMARRPYIPRLPRDLGPYLARSAEMCRWLLGQP